jgi:hypothetical protein
MPKQGENSGEVPSEDDSRDRWVSRRHVLAAATVASAGGIAGCSGLPIDGGGSTGTADGGDGGDGTPTDTATPTPEPTPATTPGVEPSDCEPRTESDNVEADTTWSPGECPRIAVDGNIKIRDGATLTIESGVEVVATEGSKLTVKGSGTFAADAGDGEPVTMVGTAAEPGHWKGIELESDNDNRFANVEVAHGGHGDWADLWVRGDARASVTNSTFAESATWGTVFKDGAEVPEFSLNRFAGNSTAALRAATTVLGSLDDLSVYAGGNGTDVIDVPNADVESEATWPATDAPYRFDGNHKLRADVAVDPGANFQFTEGSKLTVKGSGTFAADAGDGEPVTMVGTAAEPGHWKGIELESDNDNRFANVEVAHGGHGDWADLWVRGDARVSVTNSTFRDSATWGIVVKDGADVPEFSTNEFAGNGTAALRAATTVLGSLDAGSTYAGGNGTDVIDVPNADVESEATWPATDAPYRFDGNHKLRADVAVDPGANFQFTEGSKLTVKGSGTFAADAGDGEPVTMVGTAAEPGHWKGIELESDNDNRFANVEVAHGGHGDWADLWVRGDARASVTNSTFRDSATWGIVVKDGADFEGANNTFENNAESGIDDRNS